MQAWWKGLLAQDEGRGKCSCHGTAASQRKNAHRVPTYELSERLFCILLEEAGWLSWLNRQQFSTCFEAFLASPCRVHTSTQTCSIVGVKLVKGFRHKSHNFLWTDTESVKSVGKDCSHATENGLEPDSWSIPLTGLFIVFTSNSSPLHISLPRICLCCQTSGSLHSCWCCSCSWSPTEIRNNSVLTLTLTLNIISFERYVMFIKYWLISNMKESSHKTSKGHR